MAMAGRLAVFLACVAAVHALGECTRSAWFDGVRTNNLEVLDACVREGFPLDAKDEVGCPAVVNAAANQHQDVLELLHASGADMNAQCPSGSSALGYAAKLNNIALAQYLLSIGATKHLKGALANAAKAGHLRMLSLLNDIDFDLIHSWSGNELHWAAAKNEDEQLRYVLTRPGITLEGRDAHGHTPLVMAAREGAIDALKALIELGASTETSCHGGLTAAHHAAFGNKPEALQVLFNAGVNLDPLDAVGWTPAMWAAVQGHLEALSYLRNAGVNLATAHGFGWSPLLLAVNAGQSEVVHYLLRNGADWKQKTETGLSCEDIARAKGHSGLEELFRGMRETVEYERKRAKNKAHSEL